MHRSLAEVELLSRLAELLMPQYPIGECFRDFPVEPSDAWGSRWLCPDITAFGVLKEEHAAVFVEYDGYYRHSEPQGRQRDDRKTEALLRYAPAGSHVFRIGHVGRGLRAGDASTEATVDVWRAGCSSSLKTALHQAARTLVTSLEGGLQHEVRERLQALQGSQPQPRFHKAGKFVCEAVLIRDVATKKANVIAVLEGELQLSVAAIKALENRFPSIWGISIESKLKPTVAWLEHVGLSRQQVAKVVAGFPSVLGCSIDGNLKPTVAWLEDVGLSRQQVAKVVAGFPRVLGYGYSINGNLKPTVAWLEDVGLSRQQVAKVVAVHPQVLSYSIDGNLKPTVAWLEDVGLSRKQVAKVVAVAPQVLGCSIDGNLKPTVAWLEDVGLSRKQVAKVVAKFPPVLGCSIEGNLKPTVAWLEDVGLSRQQVAKVVAGFPAMLSYSINANLKPTVAWLEDVGLSREQVAKVVAGKPQVLGYSINFNLKPTVAWLEDVGLSEEQVAKVVARHPSLLGYSIHRKLKPTVAWLEGVGLSRQHVAKVVAAFPAVLGCSIMANLSLKHQLLQGCFCDSDVCHMLVYLPAMLGYSFQRLQHRLHVLQKSSQIEKLAATMALTDKRFAERFGA